MLMRRPLDWIVVSISMMVLFANRMLAPKAPERPAPARAARVEIPADPVVAQTENPFAYIREDGSQIFLPATEPRWDGKTPKVQRTSTALYTWSSPLLVNDADAPSFQ
jgi:hypothetical protein